MPAFPADDPLHAPQPLAAEANARFWLDGLGFAGFLGVMNLTTGFEERWRKAFGTGENRVIAEALLGRHGDSRPVRRNLLLAAESVGNTETEAVADVARSVLGDVGMPDEKTRRYCRNGLAARILAESPAALMGVQALDEFSPRRHYALTLDGHRVPPPAALHTLDWTEIAGRALDALPKRGSMNLRACVARSWRSDVFLAFREPGRSAPNWKGDDTLAFQLGNKLEWTWVRLLDGGHHAHIAGTEPERALEVASALATALWDRPRTYDFARDPLTPETMLRFHQALLNPAEGKFRLLEIVGELPGLHNRPTLKLGNTGQERIELALANLWDAGVGFARDPAHVLRAKVGFEHNKRNYRIEVHYPEDPLADDPVLAFGKSGVPPDVAQGFATLLRDELGVVVHPRSPADAPRRTTPWPEKPATLLPCHWDRLLAPTVLSPAPWEHAELADLARRDLVRFSRHAVFRCGSPAIFRRAGEAEGGCVGMVTGAYGAVHTDQPFVQQPGDPLVCDHCGAHWTRQRDRLPWQERLHVVVDAETAWAHVVERLRGRAGGHAVAGVLGWYAGGQVFEVISVENAAPERREVAGSVGRHTAWFGCSSSAISRYGERGVSLAEVLAGDTDAFDRVFALDPLTGTPGTVYLAADRPIPTLSTGGPRVGAPDDRGILHRRKDGGAWLLQREVVKPSHAVLVLTLAALQRATDDEQATPEARRFHRADDLVEIIHDEIKKLNADHLPRHLVIKPATVHKWVSRLRKAITDARIPDVRGPDVIEEGNTKGVRVGPRFRIEGFSVSDEARAYQMNHQAAQMAGKT